MCSIVGVLKNNESSKTIIKMNEELKHRGPNIEGYFNDGYISLGFRSLFKERNKENLFNKDKSLTAILDGNITNYKYLRKELEDKGYVFKTNVISEVLLHGYDEYKDKLFLKLKGMFSFALYNLKTNEMIIVRDKMGIKPLYYYHKDKDFMFASEIKAFLKHPSFIKKLNKDKLSTYLSFQHSPSTDTFFENVFKLRPGHFLTFKDNKVKIKKYYEFKFTQKEESIEYYIKRLEKLLKESVENNLSKDKKVGAFLSSGVDSSYLSVVSKVDNTFTVGFKNGIYDEITYASKFAEKMKLNNKYKYIDKETYFSKFSYIQYHMDEPLADPAAPALYFASNLASKDVDVVLSGEGADELFGGYLIYKEPYSVKMYLKIPFIIRKLIAKIASIFPEKFGVNFLIRKGTKLEDRYIGNANIFNEKEIKRLINQKKLNITFKDITKNQYKKAIKYDECQKMQYIDINNWLIDDILLKADKMNMANSLETRIPFLDDEIVNIASKIPTKYKLKDGHTKYVFRKAVSSSLNHEVSKKEKLGFPVPIRTWLKEEDIYNLVKEKFENSHNFFNTKYILKLLNNHYYKNIDNSRKIWTIYTFLVWYDVYFTKEA